MCKFLICNFLFAFIGPFTVLLLSFYYLPFNLSTFWPVAINGLEMYFNAKQPTTTPQSLYELTMMSSSKVHTRGLLRSLNGYRDECVEELRSQIESAIDAVRSMKVVEEDGAQLFTFPYSEDGESLEYIAVQVRKNINSAGDELVDYNIYTYTKVGTDKETENTKSQDSLFSKILKYLGLDLFLTESNSENDKMNARIEALKADFFAELLKRGIVKDRAAQYLLK